MAQAIQKLADTFGPVRAAVFTAASLILSPTLSDTGHPHPLEDFERILRVISTM